MAKAYNVVFYKMSTIGRNASSLEHRNVSRQNDGEGSVNIDHLFTDVEISISNIRFDTLLDNNFSLVSNPTHR